MTNTATAQPLTNTSHTLAFGIEIECLIPLAYEGEFQMGAYRRGLQIANAFQGWNSQYDGSLNDQEGFVAVEVVSPILAGDAGLLQVAGMVDWLDSIGAKVDRRCGIHIHVDAGNMTRKQLATVITAFVHYERAFFGMNGLFAKDRLENHYCKPSRLWDNSRYQSLNTKNYGKTGKNTLECRVFRSTLDLGVILGAIMCFVGLVAKVIDGKPVGTGASIVNPLEATKALIDETIASSYTVASPEWIIETGTKDLEKALIQKAKAAARVMPL
jgi:hypothetical protein